MIVLIQSVHSARFDCYFVEKRLCYSRLTLLILLFIVDEIRGCCGVLSMGIGTSGSENERVESISNNELGDDNRGTTTKGKCKQL